MIFDLCFLIIANLTSYPIHHNGVLKINELEYCFRCICGLGAVKKGDLRKKIP